MKKQWTSLVLAALVWLWGAAALAQDSEVLVLTQSRGPDVVEALEAWPDRGWNLTLSPKVPDDARLADLRGYDVVVVWTNRLVPDADSVALGDALADYVDGGGAVVELVFGQLSPNPDIGGRWRSQNYAATSLSGRDGVFTAGSLGSVDIEGHPIMEGISSFSVERNRSGGATALPGADVVASYDDGQILVATREDKPGRVAWLGFYPGDPNQIQGDWVRLMSQAIGWVDQDVDVNVGGPYQIEEGTPALTLTASPGGTPIRRYAWDLDNDGQFDDAQGAQAQLDSSGLDGPGVYLVGLEVETAQGLVATTMVRVSVTNLPPDFKSAAPQLVNVGSTYTYQARVEDPIGPELDPVTFELVESPSGATVSPEGLVSWQPQSEDLEAEFFFKLVARDDDGGVDEQEWTVMLRVPDADGDGVLDDVDNCPGLSNPDQEDLDGDTIGDRCDTDVDGDGLTQREEQLNGSDPRRVDTDGDGLDDAREVNELGTNPAALDSDGDGLADDVELALGSDPTQADADQDGLNDQREQDEGTDPNDPDSDDDGLNDGQELALGTDPKDPDSDDDGALDGAEVEAGTNPLSSGEVPQPGANVDDIPGGPGEGDSSCQSSPGSPRGAWWALALLGWLLWRRPSPRPIP